MNTLVRTTVAAQRRRPLALATLLIGVMGAMLGGCQPPEASGPELAATAPGGGAPPPRTGNADDFLVVDCLLPARVKRLGRQLTYLSARQPIRTSGTDCAIRGGEYVAYDRADYRTALAVWQAAAEEGDAQAQNYVGTIYERGLGTTPDYATAAQWYQRAAEQGHAPAQINLGQLYEQGLGVPKDPVVALNWYRRASGFDVAGLTYVATSDVAGDLELLRADAVVRSDEADQLRARITELQGQLSTLEQNRPPSQGAPDAALLAQLEQLRAELAAEQRALAGARVQLADQPDVNPAAERAELERMRADLVAERAALAAAQTQLARQTSDELAAARTQLEQERAALAAENEGLLIEAEELEAQRELVAQGLAVLVRRQEVLVAERQRLDAERERLEASRAQATSTTEAAELDRLLNGLRVQQLDLAEETQALDGQRNEQEAREATLAAQERAFQLREADLVEGEALLEARAQDVAASEAAVRASAVEIQAQQAAIQDRAARVQALEAAVAARDAEVQAQQRALSAREAGVQDREAAIGSRESRIRQLEAEILAREADLREQEAEASARAARLEDQEASARAQETGIDQRIAALNAEVEASRQQLQQLNSNPEIDLAGPIITMLDPKLPPTRGMAVIRTRAGSATRELVGRVNAPAGILSILVNEQPQPYNEHNVFRSTVPVPQGGVEVNVRALDSRGKRQDLSFLIQPEAAVTTEVALAGGSPPRPLDLPALDLGRFHALVIGNDDYPNLPSLDSAVFDAHAVADMLSEKYGFRVTTLIDASRYQMLSAMEELRRSLTDADNLLIYYAGHGELDQANQSGNWLPVDAEPDSRANWISNLDITNILNTMSAKRVLVVADSCYSGSLTRAALAQLEPGMSQVERIAVIKTLATKRARTALTSGGLAPTLDSGGGQHSVFAKAFLDVLSANQGLMEGQQLHREVQASVTFQAGQYEFEQVPQYAPIKRSGHGGGEFFFMPRA